MTQVFFFCFFFTLLGMSQFEYVHPVHYMVRNEQSSVWVEQCKKGVWYLKSASTVVCSNLLLA